jgi:hypothetical protein
MKHLLRTRHLRTTVLSVAALFSFAAAANAVTTDCSTNLSSANTTYTLSANTSNTCNITAAGITLNGQSHTIGSAAVPLPGTISMTNIAAVYHLNDSNVTNIVDSSGQGNGGTFNTYNNSGAWTLGVAGNLGTALHLDGSGGLYHQPMTSQISSNSNFTISAWFKSDGASQNPNSWALGYVDYNGASGAFEFSVAQQGSTFDFITGTRWQCSVDLYSPTISNITSWHLVTATLSGGTKTLYVDGAQVAQTSNGCTGPSTATQALGLGNSITSQYNIAGFYAGTLDEVALWTRALSPSEISSMYTMQSSGTAITGNGNSFTLTNTTAGGLIKSAGATITISNSTVSTIDVSGANQVGDGQAGGTINLTNTTAGALIANGGDSTDYGLGGAAGTLGTISGSTYSSFTANPGHCGPNNPSCVNIFIDQGSGDWDDAANWSKGFVPSSGDNVEIQSSVQNVSNGDASVNNALFDNGAIWDPNWNYLTLTVAGTSTFKDTTSFNYGQLNGNAEFDDNSNYNSGNISGNAVFRGSSQSNGWNIGGDAFFYDSTTLGCPYISGSAYFNGNSNAGTCNDGIGGNAYFNTTWYSGSLPIGGTLVIDGNYNGAYWANYVNGTIYGSDNNPINEFDFENGAHNDGSVYVNALFNNGSYNNNYVSGNAVFSGGSFNNYNTVQGNATFNDTSYNNYGTINGNAIFAGDSSEYFPGSIGTPPPIRYYNAPTVTTRDFTVNGPWAISADAAQVDLSGATCDPNTIFQPIDGGSFIYGPHCLAGPLGVSIIRPIQNTTVGSWSPLVNWNQGAGGYNYTGCQYSYGNIAHWNSGTFDWNVGSTEAGTWRGTSCSSNGSDIVAPSSRGTQTMVIRATYSGNNATTSVAMSTFTYLPSRLMYFYNSGSDSSWSNTANWYSDTAHTVHLNDVPGSADKVTVLAPTAPTVNIGTWTQPALINAGTTGASFTSAARATTTVQINGNATFGGLAVSSSTINGTAIFNGSSTNAGVVSLGATFNGSGLNVGRISGNATFYGDISDTRGTVVGVKTRYYNATTTTVRDLRGWTVVADGVTVDISSSTHDATTLYRTLNGGSFIGGPVTVYFWSNGSNPSWMNISNWYADAATTTPLGAIASSTVTVTTLGTVAPTVDLVSGGWQTPSGIDASRTGIVFTASTTKHLNTGVTGSTTLSGYAINDGYIAGKTSFYGHSYNSSTGAVSGSAYFYDTAMNNGGTISGDASFNNTSMNTANGVIAGNAVFNDSSYNDTTAGAIYGTATFNSAAYNSGTIINDAVFSGNYSNNNGTVQGTKTRYWNVSTSTARDFVTTAPWTLVADGATVTMLASSTFSATSTTFTTVNSGHFVGEGLPGATTCAKPLLFAGTYTLSGDIASTCDIQASGVIIDGSGHTIGHLPLELPNNAVNNGWMDMTGNVVLYHLNETMPSFTDTVTGNKYSPSTGTSVAGKLGNAMSLNGSTNLVAIDNQSLYNFPGSFSIGFWYKGSTWGSGIDWHGLVGQSMNLGSGWDIRQYSNSNHIEFEMYTQSGYPGAVAGSHNVEDGAWHYIVASYNSSNFTGTIYVDGQLDSTNTLSSPLVVANRPIYIGYESQYGYHTAMGIDELSIWNKVLTQSDVQSLYNSGNGMALVGNESNLLSLFHFNESSYTTPVTTDSSGHGNNGTIAGGVTTVSGPLNTAYHFNGTDSYVDFEGQPAVLDSNHNWTVSMWIKPENNNNQQAFFFGYNDQNYTGGTFQIDFVQNHNGSDPLAVSFGTGKAWQSFDDMSVDLPDTNWHLFTAVYNNQVKTLYLDGVQVASKSDPNANGSPSSNVRFTLGAFYPYGGGQQTFYKGGIDETAIWSRALSPSEVSTLYATQSSGIAVTGNGNNFNLTNLTAGGLIKSTGASITITDSTVSAVNVTGADAAGDAQAGGAIHLINSHGGALVANGGNSTDYGYGGAAGVITLDNTSTAVSQTANPGTNGPNKGSGQQNTGGSSSSSPIPGCTDPSASNYNVNATVDNGSCRYSSSQVRGCTDPSATNFNVFATVNDGSCHYSSYNQYTPPSSGSGGGGNNSNNTPAFNGISVSVNSSATGNLYLKPIPGFAFGVDGAGNTNLGNPLAGLKPLGSLDLKGINFSFTLPISDFLFAPLPKTVTDALNKAPKLSDTLASVGIARAQDLVKLNRQSIKLPAASDGLTPGLFTVVDGTTTLDTYVASDARHEIVEQITVKPGDALDISLLPVNKGKVLATFNDRIISFATASNGTVLTSVIAPVEPGRYILATDSAPLALAIDVVVPQPQAQSQAGQGLSWWQRVLKWFGRSP